MATEAPLLHHTQCTAGANFSSTAGLGGFNGTGQFLVVAITAARSVVLCTAATTQPAGILQNDPISGFVADIGFLGVSKVIALGAISAGAQLTSAAGGLVTTLTPGALNIPVGYALEAATAANQVITAMIFPAGSY